MRIGIIGGAEKTQSRLRYEQVAREHGGSVEFHDGHMEGRGSESLHSLVERCDLVVIVTRVNSHNAVRLARSLVRKLGRPALIVPRFGLSRFESALRNRPVAGTAIHAA
jgi:hypothetical protein